ncbi:ROK family protein [Marinifilum sp. D714]|uniref:ROK family protein n=1 Tax=Marinifilum sp. D714 TaxID=2937523 RepID=UPI0027CF3B85|nr:ROK family protein [Marinifilum sp. D714]MDQ2179337.1 ROK family protein [Marinifilum sp. D714]
MKKQIAIGIDVGGSHASCAAFDLTEKRLITESISHISLNNQGSKTEVIDGFVTLIQTCVGKLSAESLVGIGIAMPGPFDYEKGIGLFTGENAKFQCLNKVNVESELKERLNLPEIPVRFINDATAFAIGEYFLGQLKGCKHTLAITLGTGLGSAFLSDGIPVIVDEKVPENGCIWHLPFENGIADDYFSTRGLVNRYFERTGTKLKGVKELADLSKENSMALELFNDFGEKLALFLAPWIKSFQVEAIVFGGNISKASHLFNDTMNEQFKKEGLLVKINYSELQESAAFVGGAQLLNEEFWSLVKSQLKYM